MVHRWLVTEWGSRRHHRHRRLLGLVRRRRRLGRLGRLCLEGAGALGEGRLEVSFAELATRLTGEERGGRGVSLVCSCLPRCACGRAKGCLYLCLSCEVCPSVPIVLSPCAWRAEARSRSTSSVSISWATACSAGWRACPPLHVSAAKAAVTHAAGRESGSVGGAGGAAVGSKPLGRSDGGAGSLPSGSSKEEVRSILLPPRRR
mmetsp:Transcript_45064/g.146397  ORF Transcript_45064/g.146397 Transcript_45064/m.146397 type:complete len:204 (-) Transcript_45064:319-930(-)